jgi:uncharacterized membrane protein YphA (DoxX/SURF4 family)
MNRTGSQPRLGPTKEIIMSAAVTVGPETTSAPKQSRIARYAPHVVRVVLGLLFVVTGLNGFLNFLPQPAAAMPANAVAFITALMNTGYMFKLIFATQLVSGVLLLSNRFVPLALALLAPFVVNSISFHLFLEPTGRPVAFAVLAAELYLAWTYRRAYRSMLLPKFER